MSMADDSNVRTRRSENLHPDSEAGKTSERPPGDPLAELARLIGQDDLFNQMRKDAAQADGRATARHPETDEPGPAPDWLSRARPAAGEFRRSSGEASQDARAYPHGDPLAEAHRQPARAAASADDAQHAAGTEGDEHDPRYADPQGSYPSTAYDQQAAYDQAYAGNDAAAYEPDPYAADAGYDETYEEPVRERRRGGLITVAAVLGLAVVGTAGAFGYRAFTGSGGGTQPPVIKADSMPAKVAPAPASNDAQGSKLIYDRAEKPQAERVVSREEQPIEMKDAGPKMLMTSATSATGPQATPSQTAVAYAPASTASGTVATEPKKVKTFAIRPDGTSGTESSRSRSPGTSAPTRVAARQPADATRAPTGAPTRTASIPAPAAATASTPPVSSAYVVQLVSNKREAEAQSAFKVLQSKYPAVLGNRTALIRRVELGDRGTYYRAQVGPFANADQANVLCDKLKSAGGQCIVHKN
jgi:SPOR domain